MILAMTHDYIINIFIGGYFLKFRSKDFGGLLLVLIISVCMLLGTVSAIYTTTYSSNGKIVTVAKPTMKDKLSASFHVTNNYNPFGYIINSDMNGKIWGTDYSGRSVYQYGTVSGSYLVPSKLIISNGGFKWFSTIQWSGSTAFSEKITGSMNPTNSFYGSSIYSLNSDGDVKKRSTTLQFMHSGAKSASCTITSIPIYQTGTGSILKFTTTMKTLFTNGNSRISVITTNYKRSSSGLLLGMTTTGISYGQEKVNGKRVTYTGRISIPTKFDSENGYHLGSYREVKTSSSSTLNKIKPYESVLYDNYIIHPEKSVIPAPMH